MDVVAARKLLGVKENASQDDIKRAYWAMAKKYHPDKNKGAGAGIFKLVGEAYEFLKNFKDLDRPSASQKTSAPRASVSKDPSGSAKKSSGPTTPSLGPKVMQGYAKCPNCKGAGKKGILKIRCKKCNGAGKIPVIWPGQGWKWCPVCRGRGKVGDSFMADHLFLSLDCSCCSGNKVVRDLKGFRCPECEGKGWIRPFLPNPFEGNREACSHCSGTGVAGKTT